MTAVTEFIPKILLASVQCSRHCVGNCEETEATKWNWEPRSWKTWNHKEDDGDQDNGDLKLFSSHSADAFWPSDTRLRRERLQGPCVASSPQSEMHISFVQLLQRPCMPSAHPFCIQRGLSAAAAFLTAPSHGCSGQKPGLEGTPGSCLQKAGPGQEEDRASFTSCRPWVLPPPRRCGGRGARARHLRELGWGRGGWWRWGLRRSRLHRIDVRLSARHFGDCLGKNTPSALLPGSNQMLTLLALNFPNPALGTSPAHEAGRGPFPRYGAKVHGAALPAWGHGSQHSMLFQGRCFTLQQSVSLKWGTWDMKCLFLLNTHSIITVLSPPCPEGTCLWVLCNGY